MVDAESTTQMWARQVKKAARSHVDIGRGSTVNYGGRGCRAWWSTYLHVKFVLKKKSDEQEG